MQSIQLISILLITINTISCDVLSETPPSLFCTDLTPQNNVDIDQVRNIFNTNLNIVKKRPNIEKYDFSDFDFIIWEFLIYSYKFFLAKKIVFAVKGLKRNFCD